MLAVERAIRRAAGAANQLLSAATVAVDVADPDQRSWMFAALRGMGARPAAGERAEFVFADRAEYAAARDDAVIAGLDGCVRSPRGCDAAARIDWAKQRLRATAELAEGLRPARIAMSLVLEPKTAAFALLLAELGCEVAVFGATEETDFEVAAALAATGRVEVFAPTRPVSSAEPAQTLDARNARTTIDWDAELLIDDGSHLIRLAHTAEQRGPNPAFGALRGAAEETTSGVRPLREMQAEGALGLPVIAVNDARTKTEFDNLVGTGQSCVFAIADLLDGVGRGGVDGTRWVVIGYGPVGVGVARFAAALGARVTVVERDPVRALAALHDGFEARTAAEALPEADIVVSATGIWHTLTAELLTAARPGCAVAVAGGVDDEVALDETDRSGWLRRPKGEHVEELVPPGSDRGLLLLAGGAGVNYTAGEGNPVEVMDLSFATQIAALIELQRGDLAPGVHTLPRGAEERVARAALGAMGGECDPTPRDARPGGAAQHWRVHRYLGGA